VTVDLAAEKAGGGGAKSFISKKSFSALKHLFHRSVSKFSKWNPQQHSHAFSFGLCPSSCCRPCSDWEPVENFKNPRIDVCWAPFFCTFTVLPSFACGIDALQFLKSSYTFSTTPFRRASPLPRVRAPLRAALRKVRSHSSRDFASCRIEISPSANNRPNTIRRGPGTGQG